MEKKWIIAILMGALLTAGCAPQQETPAPETTKPAASEAAAEETEETVPPLPDSVLYYGEIREISKDNQGNPEKLLMESPRDGAYVMNLGEGTAYIDSGKRTAFSPDRLQEGDQVYVFHSPIATRSLPPQSNAFAVVGYIPMDASCGMYHQVEALQQQGDQLRITVENGTKTLGADEDTQLLSYEGEVLELSALQEGDYVIAWYWDRGEEILHPSHLMLLPKGERPI